MSKKIRKLFSEGEPENTETRIRALKVLLFFMNTIFYFKPTYAHHERAKKNGAPDRNRTCNPLLRRQVLYPVELRAP